MSLTPSEIVLAIAQSDPVDIIDVYCDEPVKGCAHCRVECDRAGAVAHADDCLWKAARRLTHPEVA